MHGQEPKGNNADLWLEVVKKDLKGVKMMLARRALLPDFKEVEWLRWYAKILLHQGLETTSGAAGRRCPALGTTAEVSLANSATTDDMSAVSQFLTPV